MGFCKNAYGFLISRFLRNSASSRTPFQNLGVKDVPFYF